MPDRSIARMLSPSLMCGKMTELEKTLRLFEKEKIEYLHIDVMDGHFVPNLQFGTDLVRQIRQMTDIPLDLHLMVEEPERMLGWFDPQPGELVSIHFESTAHVQKCLADLSSRGAKAMLALNPATPLSALDEVMDDLSGVLLMTVNPGFAGQKIIPSTIGKTARLRRLLTERGYGALPIEVDGNVSFENAKKLSEAGASIFVAGTSSVYHKDYEMADAIRLTREAIG